MYEALADAVEEAVFITEPQGRMIYANPALERLTGYTVADFQFPQADNPFLHPDDAERVGRFIAEFIAGGARTSEPIENRFSDRWGQTRRYRSLLSRVTFEGKEAIQFVTRRAEEESAAVEEPGVLRDFRAIVENAGDGIVKLDRQGRFIFTNATFQRIVGRDSVALGRGDLAAVAHAQDDARRFLVPGRFQTRLVGANGEVVWVEVVVTPLAEGGEVLATVRDVTEKRRLEQQLERRQRFESLGLLAGGIAHDFNNLLTVVGVNATLCEMAARKGTDPVPLLVDIHLACAKAATICQRLLTAAGRAQMTRARIDLSAVVVEVAQLMASSLPPGARLSTEVAGPANIEGDAGAIQSVLMNLVTNAAESLEGRPGKVTVSVDLLDCSRDDLARLEGEGAAAPGRFARVLVKDDGTGMNEATRARMFDPFFTTKAAGHGLGLSAVLGTVRAHAGGISVESSPGLGTSVAVFLPLAKPPEPHEGEDAASGPPRSKRGAGRTILLADDEDALRRSVGKILEAAGYRVISAKDGLEAIAAWRDHKTTIDVALLDAVMPHAGGIAAAIEIRNAARKVPIVIMTGYSVDDIAADGVTVLTKPFTAEVLLSTLDRVIAG
jgi:PAS domain S-box-containing protein